MQARQRFWVFERNEEKTECKISVKGKISEQVNEVICNLGSIFSRDGRYEMDAEMRTADGYRVNGA